MTNDLPTVTGPIDTLRKGPRQRGIVGLVAAILGAALAFGGFYFVIQDALNGGGNGPTVSLVVVVLGLAFMAIALVLGVASLVTRASKVISIITIVVAVLPLAAFVTVLIAVRIG